MDNAPSNGDEGERDYSTGIEIARETMTGDVRDALLDQVKHAKLGGTPWAKMTEQQQRGLIDRFSTLADDVVARVARIVAADGRMVISGEVDKLDVKDGKDGALLQARFVCHRSEGSLTSLGMAVGKTVSMLIQDIQPFRGERAPARPDPDQPNLGLAGRIDMTSAPKGDDGMTANAGEAFTLPPLIDETPRIELACEMGGRVRIAAVQFAAYALVMGVPVEGRVSAQFEDESASQRCTSVIFTAPMESELESVDFALSLLDDTGKATADVVVVIRYVREVAAGAADQDPRPEDGGDTGETFEAAPPFDQDRDTGSAPAGEDDDGPTSSLAGPTPPPPAARGIKRARGRRPTQH